MKEQLFHLVSVRIDNGKETPLTRYPMTRKQCEENRRRFTRHSFRKIELKEAHHADTMAR